MTILATWAAEWGIAPAAVVDLQRRMGVLATGAGADEAASEAGVSSRVRLIATERGDRLFRNNVGVLPDLRGVPLRFGLANDSAAVNRSIKSGDLIGWTRVTITPQMVGATVAVFTSIEAKRPAWRFTNTERERAQLQWAELVLAAGGRAQFVSDLAAF